MAREELAKQHEARRRAEADLNTALDFVDDRQVDKNESHEIPSSRPQADSSLRHEQARCLPSPSLVLEENGLLGPTSAEQALLQMEYRCSCLV